MNIGWIGSMDKAEVVDGTPFLTFLATGPELDRQGERVSRGVAEKVVAAGKAGTIFLAPSHDVPIQLAKSVDGWMDGAGHAFLKFQVDAEDPVAMKTFKGFESGSWVPSVSLGAEKVTRSVAFEMGKAVKTIDDIETEDPSKPVHLALAFPSRNVYPLAGFVEAMKKAEGDPEGARKTAEEFIEKAFTPEEGMEKGDVPGHEFHGNQYTGGGGRDTGAMRQRGSLNKDNAVHATDRAEGFAKEYMRGHRGDFRPGGPTEQDEKGSEHFWGKHDSRSVENGFAGSGKTIFTDKETGRSYEVTRSANGKGFYGTDHHIREVTDEDVGKSSPQEDGMQKTEGDGSTPPPTPPADPPPPETPPSADPPQETPPPAEGESTPPAPPQEPEVKPEDPAVKALREHLARVEGELEALKKSTAAPPSHVVVLPNLDTDPATAPAAVPGPPGEGAEKVRKSVEDRIASLKKTIDATRDLSIKSGLIQEHGALLSKLSKMS